MKAASVLFALLVPLAVQAQDTTALAAPPAPAREADVPPRLAEVEAARSRACVGALGRIEELDSILQPYAERMERLRALGRAVSLEDRAEAGEMDPADSVAVAVAAWFASDSVLAARYVADRSEATQQERTREREAILERIRAAMEAVGAEAQGLIGDAAALEAAARPCENAIFVRGAVLEACAGGGGRLCRAAADTALGGPYRFVAAAADLWDVEDYRPWVAPAPLQGTPQGALVGARTAAQGRRGNVVLGVALAPLLRTRQELDSAQIAELEANLDSLGYAFEHPLFLMAPVIEMEANVPAPVGGETHVLLHFGDLSGDDVIWSAEVGEGGVLQATVLASAAQLARLQAGEMVSLTAVRVPEGENPTAEPIYTVGILQVGQVEHVSALLAYMSDGSLGRDLSALVPPPPAGGP